MTLLSPVLIVAAILLPFLLTTITDPNLKTVTVFDQTGKYASAFQSNESYHFEMIGEAKADANNYALIIISDDLAVNPDAVCIYAENQVGLEFKSYVAGLLNSFVEDEKLTSYNIPNLKQLIEQSKTSVNIRTVQWSEDGTKGVETSSEVALIVGMIAAFLIYMFVLIYGAQVMRGIVEEKTNRIVEVIISSVKPFQLMMGKIIGIALVGLTQFLIWIVLTVAIVAAIGVGSVNPSDLQETALLSTQSAQEQLSAQLLASLSFFDFKAITIYFVIYFLCGYLLYASLFAAIGAASDTETDTQQFMIPLMIPIIFALYAAIYSASSPDAPLAFWTSIIPFTSPIVMMVRIPMGVALWEILLSLLVLFSSFVATTWIAAKIYRTGILMYGKKITYKELWKWLRAK
jgi:ABC-2 type transport system permease protein